MPDGSTGNGRSSAWGTCLSATSSRPHLLRTEKINKIQWGWGSEYQKHLNTKIFEVQISNGWSMSYVLCTRLDHLNTKPVHKRKMASIRPVFNGWAIQYSSGIRKPDHLGSDLFSTT